MMAPRLLDVDRRLLLLAAVGLLGAIVVRLAVLPMEGFAGDLDQFILWVRDIGEAPLGQAFRLDLTFPPVMVYQFAAMGAVTGLLGHAVDAADPLVRAIVKTPASLADLALAFGVAFALRDRPRWATLAFLALALNPALIYVSAWWGQFESLYVLAVLISVLLARAGRLNLAAVALGVALMTKPQALFFVVPMIAWVLGRHGWRSLVRSGLVTALTASVLWLPFIPYGGIQAYSHNLDVYGNQIFSVASLRAWNMWWIMQQASGGDQFLADTATLAGPLSGRSVAIMLAGVAELVVFLSVVQRPTMRNLALGVAASVLVCFSLLTTMHERYAFGGLVFLTLLLPEPRLRVIWIVFNVIFAANLFAAAPPNSTVAELLPVNGPLSIAGSVGVLLLTAAVLWALAHPERQAEEGVVLATEEVSESGAQRKAIPAQVVR
jgi:dolichyl-phosphate-mannose-protein mannosyltransferase